MGSSDVSLGKLLQSSADTGFWKRMFKLQAQKLSSNMEKELYNVVEMTQKKMKE